MAPTTKSSHSAELWPNSVGICGVTNVINYYYLAVEIVLPHSRAVVVLILFGGCFSFWRTTADDIWPQIEPDDMLIIARETDSYSAGERESFI